jgi:hypothetical protein
MSIVRTNQVTEREFCIMLFCELVLITLYSDLLSPTEVGDKHEAESWSKDVWGLTLCCLPSCKALLNVLALSPAYSLLR